MARSNSVGRVGTTGTLAALLAPLGVAQGSAPPARQLAEALRDAAREWLAAPTPHERVGEPLAPGRLARLLEDSHLELRAFEREGDSALALGFTYDLAKTLRTPDAPDEPTIDFLAAGQFAFESNANPQDYLDTGVRLRWAGSLPLGGKKTRAALAQELPVPEFDALTALDPERVGRLTSELEHTPAEELRGGDDFHALAQRYFDGLTRGLAPELAWGFDVHAALESTQDFSSRQVVLGSTLAGRLLAWDESSALARRNVFDLPAAALRWLAGQDEHFHLTAEALPTLAAGLDVVDASGDDVRGDLTDDDSYLRARLELGLASHALRLADEDLVLSLRWRYFGEIDAPTPVRRANTDETSQLELRLVLPRGWALSFAAGTLPLDETYDSSFGLGYELRL